jgi:hypothetical protein
MEDSKGPGSVSEMTEALVPRMQQFSRDMRSLLEDVLDQKIQ